MTNLNLNPLAQIGQMAPKTVYPQGQRGSFGASMIGQNPSYTMTPNYTQQQIGAMNTILDKALSSLGNFDFGPIEQQARSGFAEKTIPSILERLSGVGAMRSSALPQLMGAAGADLEQSLAAMKQNYGLQQESMMHNLLGMGLRPQFDTQYDKGTTGMLPDILSLIASLAGGYFGLPMPKTSGLWKQGIDYMGDTGFTQRGTVFGQNQAPSVGLI